MHEHTRYIELEGVRNQDQNTKITWYFSSFVIKSQQASLLANTASKTARSHQIKETAQSQAQKTTTLLTPAQANTLLSTGIRQYSRRVSWTLFN